MTYLEKLRDPRWQKKRLLVLDRAGWKCECCEDSTETLEIHHLIYSPGEPWDAPDKTLECLCSTCHQFRTEFDEFFERGMAPTRECDLFRSNFKTLFKRWHELRPQYQTAEGCCEWFGNCLKSWREKHREKREREALSIPAPSSEAEKMDNLSDKPAQECR